MDIEAVGEEDGLVFFEIRFDVGFVDVRHGDIGGAEHDDVGLLNGFAGLADLETILFGCLAGFAGGVEANGDVDAAIAEIERVGVTL